MLIVKELSKSFYNKNGRLRLFDAFNLKIATGEFVSIIGNNGCGKTTLLNIIAGIESFDKGILLINNKKIKEARIGYVFQNYNQTLLPWLNVIDNISLPLKLKGKGKEERYAQAKSLCDRYRIRINHEEYPYNLSGGQQQLVVIARSLIDDPDVVLMDEPFSSLDYYTSLEIQHKILEIWQDTKKTVVFVSHRIDEAVYLSNRIIMLGRSPTEIKEDFRNPLPYPRRLSILTSKGFNALRKQILSKLDKQHIMEGV